MPKIVIPDTVCDRMSNEPYNLVIYGLPGSGKTPCCAILSEVFNSYYIDCQVNCGTRYVKCRRIQPTCYEDFEAVLDQYRTKPSPFLIIDPLTILVDWADRKATDWYHSVPIGQGDYGQSIQSVLDMKGVGDNIGGPGWMYLRKNFMQMIAKAWALPQTRTIFVGHVRDSLLGDAKNSKASTGAEVNGKDLDLPGKLAAIFLSETDLTGYLFKSAIGCPKITFASSKSDTLNKSRPPAFAKPRTLDLHNPCTIDDWKQIYPDTIKRLMGSIQTPAPTTIVPNAVTAAAPVAAKA